MPSEMSKLKKILTFRLAFYFLISTVFLSFEQQISKNNLGINKMRCLNTMFDVKEDTNRKYNAINELKTLRKKIITDNKEIIRFLCTLFVLNNSLS